MKFAVRYTKAPNHYSIINAPNLSIARNQAQYYRSDAVVYGFEQAVLSFKDLTTKQFIRVDVDDSTFSDKFHEYDLLLGEENLSSIVCHELEIAQNLQKMSFDCYDEKGKEKVVHGRNGVIINMQGFKYPVFAKKLNGVMFPIRAIRKVEKKEQLKLESSPDENF